MEFFDWFNDGAKRSPSIAELPCCQASSAHNFHELLAYQIKSEQPIQFNLQMSDWRHDQLLLNLLIM